MHLHDDFGDASSSLSGSISSFQISESFFELTTIFFKIIVALCLSVRGGEAFVLNC